MAADENLRLTDQYLSAYNRHDLQAIAGFWADAQEGNARAEFQKNYWLAAFPDTRIKLVRRIADGDLVITELIVRATHLGTLKFWVTEPFPATKKKIEFHYCSAGQWENGKLIELRNYVNAATILGQLGVTETIDWNAFI